MQQVRKEKERKKKKKGGERKKQYGQKNIEHLKLQL